MAAILRDLSNRGAPITPEVIRVLESIADEADRAAARLLGASAPAIPRRRRGGAPREQPVAASVQAPPKPPLRAPIPPPPPQTPPPPSNGPGVPAPPKAPEEPPRPEAPAPPPGERPAATAPGQPGTRLREAQVALSRAFRALGPHALPLAALALLDLAMLRSILFGGGVPDSVDAGFLYSALEYFNTHDVGAFSLWLSYPFGEIQQFSIYWLLAGIPGPWGPVTLVKATMVVTVLTTSAGAYGLCHWLTRERLASALAAALYTLTPFFVAEIVGGHANVGISYAVGPLFIWALWSALRKGSTAAMIGAGLAGSALYMLTTGQGIYWLLPAAAVIVGELVAADRRKELTPQLRTLGRTVGVALGVFVLASAAQILPNLAGSRGAYTEGGASYYIEQLSIHERYSEPLAGTVLGEPVEDWTIPSAGFPDEFFGGAVAPLAIAILLLIATQALWKVRDRRAVLLSIPLLASWLLATGPEGPMGALYRYLWAHVPFFSLLRVPNRWLMVSMLCLAVLVALTLAGRRDDKPKPGVLSKVLPDLGGMRPRTKLAIVVAALTFVIGGYAVINGIPTRELPASYERSYSALRSDPGDWRMLTTPYFQSWMETGGEEGSDVEIAADLGYTSPYWHGRGTVGRGGWDARAARFASYIQEEMERGTNPSLTKLLGAAGVKYLALNPYPAFETVTGQNPFFGSQQGLTQVSNEDGIEIYENQYAMPQAYVTQRECIVAGGMNTLGDLAALPSFDFRTTGIRYADQIAAINGSEALRSALGSASCLIVAPGGEQLLAQLLGEVETRDALDFAAPTWDRLSVPASLDLGAEPSSGVNVPPGETLSGELNAPESRSYRLWIAGIHEPQAGELEVRVDGDPAGLVPLASPGGQGVRWAQTTSLPLGPGTHSFELTNLAGPANRDATLTKVSLVPSDEGEWTPGRGRRVITATGGVGPLPSGRPVLEPSLLTKPWARLANDSGSVEATLRGPSAVDLRVLEGDRSYFTLATAGSRPVDPYRPLALRFTGAASGRTFMLIAEFDDKGEEAAGFSFVDTSREPRTLLFSPLQPAFVSTIPDWFRIRRFKISSTSKAALRESVSFDGPFTVSNQNLRPRFSLAGAPWNGPSPGAPATPALDPPEQLIADRAELGPDLPAGQLNFMQSYNAGWELQGSGGEHSVTLGFANSYGLEPGAQPEAVEFGPAGWGIAGSVISLLAWLGFGGLLIYLVGRGLTTPAPVTSPASPRR